MQKYLRFLKNTAQNLNFEHAKTAKNANNFDILLQKHREIIMFFCKNNKKCAKTMYTKCRIGHGIVFANYYEQIVAKQILF